MSYYEIYMQLMKTKQNQLSEEAIRNLASFLDNQNYYEFTKQINEQKIEEVTKVNEEITIESFKVNEEKVVELNKEVAFENLSNIILDLKPEELKNKFLEYNIDKKQIYSNLETLNTIVPENSEIKEVLIDVKKELDLKPINNISDKSVQDYYYNNIKNNEFNFSKPEVKFDTSFLGIKEYPNYQDIDLSSIDLSKPKSKINIDTTNKSIEQPIVENKNISYNIPIENKILMKEPLSEYVDRNFKNISEDKLTLSGYNNKILEFEDLKNKTNNPDKKELYELLQVSSFSKMIESIDEYNKNYEKNIIEKIQQDIQNNTFYQNQKEIQRQMEEERHKDDNKVKTSSILGSLGLMGLLLDNLNATYITKEEHDLQVKKHNKMLEEKDNEIKKFEENLDIKKDLDKDKEKSNYYYASISSIYAFKTMELKANLMIANKSFSDYSDNIDNGKYDVKDSAEEMITGASSLLSVMSSIESFLSDSDKELLNKHKKEFQKVLNKDIDGLDGYIHGSSGDFLMMLGRNPEALKQLLLTENGAEMILNMQKNRIDTVVQNINKNTGAINRLQEELNNAKSIEEKERLEKEIQEFKRRNNLYEKERIKLEKQDEEINLIKQNNNLSFQEKNEQLSNIISQRNQSLNNVEDNKGFKNDNQKMIETLEKMNNSKSNDIEKYNKINENLIEEHNLSGL